jgi:hypothetical protein
MRDSMTHSLARSSCMILLVAGISDPDADLPPAPTPRPVVFAFARQGVDLYTIANYLFVTCATGYLLADLSRVAYPAAMINDTVGSNVTNAAFMFFALLYVVDCTLYFLVYNKWEQEALDEVRDRVVRGEKAEEDASADGEADAEAAPTDEADESGILGHGVASSSSSSEGIHRRKAPPAAPDFAHRLLSDGRVVAAKARWCFFSHEGGMVNTMEITAAIIYATGATMSFFAGVANVERIIQRRWDSATMTGDTIASAIFLSDSILFHHIYTRTLQTQAKLAGGSGSTSCIQTKDPYFWTSIFNVIGSAISFCAALWGILRQNHISSLDNDIPGSYTKNMLPMLQTLHALYLAGDVF